MPPKFENKQELNQYVVAGIENEGLGYYLLHHTGPEVADELDPDLAAMWRVFCTTADAIKAHVRRVAGGAG